MKRKNRSSYLQRVALKLIQLFPYLLIISVIGQANQRAGNAGDATLPESYPSQILTTLENGRLHMEIGDYGKAREFFSIAVELAAQNQDTFALGNTYIYQGVNEVRDGKLRKGKSSLLSALELTEHIDAESVVQLHTELGRFYLISGQANLAIDHYKDAIPILDSLGKKHQAASLWIKIGEVYLDQILDPEQAQLSFGQGLALLEPGVQNSLGLEALLGLARAHQEVGDSSLALGFARQSLEIRAALEDQSGTLDQGVACLLDHYEDFGKTGPDQLSFPAWTPDRYLLGSGLVLSLVFGFYQFYQRKRFEEFSAIDRVLIEQRHLLSQEHLRDMKQSYQGTAQHLHDRLGALLSTAKMFFNAIDLENSDQVLASDRENFGRVADLLDQSFTEVRVATDRMQSDVAHNFGINRDLEAYMSLLNKKGEIEGEVSVFGFGEELDQDRERQINGLVHSLIAYVFKYSGAGKMSVQLNQFDNLINIIVEDDGRGGVERFLPLPGRRTNWKYIMELADAAGGLVKTDRKKGRGTTVSIDLPGNRSGIQPT